MFEIRDLVVKYGGITAVDRISLHIDDGETVALIGANGAGKSSALRAVSGLQRIASGEISFGGQRIDGIGPDKIVQKGIVQVPEGRQIFTRLTVEENLQMGAYVSRDKRQIEDNHERVLSLFPILRERAKQSAGTLSGGEQQMLAMGRALMSKPELLMLDEPSMGLAPILVQEIFDIIEELNKQGTTILLVEQNASMALSIADRGYVLEVGHISKTGTGADLLHDDDVRKAYLGG